MIRVTVAHVKVEGSWYQILMRITVALLAVLLLSSALFARQASLSGTWNTTCDFDLSTGDIEPSVDFSIDWAHSILDLSLDCSLHKDGLDEMSLAGSFRLGDFDFTGEIDLEGAAPFFDGAELSVCWPGTQSSWDLLLEITGSSSSTSLTLTGDGTLSFGHWDLEIEMRGCGFDYEELTFQLSDIEFSCVSDIEFEVVFDCSGFDSAEISFGDIEISALGFLSISGAISYELDSKKVSTRFLASPDASESCIGVSLKLVTEGTSITGLEITGINLRCDIGRIKFTYAHTTAWDAITLSGGASGECAVSWTSQVYMRNSSPYLFGVDSVSFSLTYAPCSAYSFVMKTKCEMAGGAEIELALRGRF